MTIDKTAHGTNDFTTADRGYIPRKPIPSGIRLSELGFRIAIETREPYRLRPSNEKTPDFDLPGYSRTPQ
jgi:hypothetical protein